jgi:cell division protein FtsL
MSASEEPSRARSVAGFRGPSEKALLVTIAVAFLVLHILAGSILLARSTAPIAPQAADLSSDD